MSVIVTCDMCKVKKESMGKMKFPDGWFRVTEYRGKRVAHICESCFNKIMGESKKEIWLALTEQERLEVRRKAQQELIKKIEKLVNKRIKELKTDANNNKEAETKIVLKNCANELKYFWKDVKKEVEK